MEALAVAGKLQDEEKVKVLTWLIGDRGRMREMFGFELAAGEEVEVGNWEVGGGQLYFVFLQTEAKFDQPGMAVIGLQKNISIVSSKPTTFSTLTQIIRQRQHW